MAVTDRHADRWRPPTRPINGATSHLIQLVGPIRIGAAQQTMDNELSARPGPALLRPADQPAISTSTEAPPTGPRGQLAIYRPARQVSPPPM